MLFVLFQLGADRYALEATQVAEILPMVQLKQLPHAPLGVAGLCNYHGQPVPVIDLCELATGIRAQARLSTRMMLVRYQRTLGSTQHMLGLVAERATTLLRCDPDAFQATGIHDKETPYLGPVTHDQQGLIQRIQINQLLSPAVESLLFDRENHEPGSH